MAESGKQTMPKWQKAPPELVRTFGEMVQPMAGVELRQMFGYPSAFFQGQMFAGLFGDSMIIRLPEEERARFLAIEGAAQFEPMEGRPMREYVRIPPAMLAQPAELSAWLDRALAYVASLPAKEPKKSRKSAKLGTG